MHHLLKSLRGSRYAPAVPSDSVPRTKPVSSWTGFKPLAVSIPKLRVAPCPTIPRRKAKLDRNERAKMARLLEGYNRRTREVGPSGRRNQGALKASGVEIGKELLFGYYNPNTGQLDPSDATIAAETGWSVRTVCRARERLRLSGLLSWFRRSKWINGAWRPFSNRYAFGQLGAQSTGRFILDWGKRVAEAPSVLLTGLAADLGLVVL